MRVRMTLADRQKLDYIRPKHILEAAAGRREAEE